MRTPTIGLGIVVVSTALVGTSAAADRPVSGGTTPVSKQAKAKRPVREGTEWCQMRWLSAPDTKRPRVLLVGDSIVVGYSGVVAQALKGKANVDMLATSKSIMDPSFIKETRLIADGYEHAIIHFNNGLHGGHVTDDQYAAHLTRYVKELRRLAPKAKLIWASSTPISARGDRKKLSPKNAVVVRRNKIAAAIMEKNSIPIDDLYTLVVGKAALRSPDGYHYSTQGRTIQGKAVAALLVKALKDAKTK
jgi:hypothetical protein